MDASPRNRGQLRGAGPRANGRRRAPRRLHAPQRHEGGSRPPRDQPRRCGRRRRGRARRLVLDVSPGPAADAGRLAARLLRRDPHYEPGRDEQRHEHGNRTGVGRAVDAQAGQVRAVDVRLRDGRRGRGTGEGRDAGLDVVGVAGPRIPLRGRAQHRRRQYPADGLLPVHARGRGRLGERTGVGRLPLERERCPGPVRERDRPERRPGRPSARPGVGVRQELDLPGQPNVAQRSHRRRQRLPVLRAGIPDLQVAGPLEGRRRQTAGRAQGRPQRARQPRGGSERATLAHVGAERGDLCRAHEQVRDEGRSGERSSPAERRLDLPPERRGLGGSARPDRKPPGRRQPVALAPAGVAQAHADGVDQAVGQRPHGRFSRARCR